VWLEIFTKKVGEKRDTETFVFHDLPFVVKMLEAEEVDLVILLPLEYLEIRRQVPLVPMVVGSREGKLGYEYGLLVHRGSGKTSLAELNAGRLIIEIAGNRDTGIRSWGHPVGLFWVLPEYLENGTMPESCFFDPVIALVKEHEKRKARSGGER